MEQAPNLVFWMIKLKLKNLYNYFFILILQKYNKTNKNIFI